MENATAVVNVTSPVYTEEFSDLILYLKPPRWSLNVELVLMFIVFIFGVPGNALLILVQAKTVNKTSTDYLVMIMAMYELFGSGVNSLVKMTFDIEAVWMAVSSVFICKLHFCSYNLAQYGAGQTLGALAVDRLIKTLFPLNSWYNVKVPLAISACIFLTSLAVSIPHLITQEWDPVSLQCALTISNFQLGKNVGLVGSALMIAVFCSLSTCYALIALSLRRRHLRKLKQHKAKPTSALTDISTAAEATSEETTAVSEKKVEYVVQTKSDSNEAPTTKPKAKGGSRVLTLEGRNVNKLTVLMFMISLLYVATNLLIWYLYVTYAFSLGVGVLQVAYAIPMLNCITNPIMFIVMSSRFRQNVRMLLSKNRK